MVTATRAAAAAVTSTAADAYWQIAPQIDHHMDQREGLGITICENDELSRVQVNMNADNNRPQDW
jgi:hypothetical protein